jgi:uncharacterized membrane protein YcaP (DUF421 family)
MSIQWNELFVFGVSPWELFMRGSLMYWFIFILLRLAGRRDFGSIGSADVLLVVLIADAAQNAMSAEYKSVAEGMVLVGTLILWSVILDRVSYFWPAVDRMLDPGRVCLIKDGIMQRRGMRREYVTRDELMSELRQHGVEDLSEVRRAYMESQGEISVLKVKR